MTGFIADETITEGKVSDCDDSGTETIQIKQRRKTKGKKGENQQAWYNVKQVIMSTDVQQGCQEIQWSKDNLFKSGTTLVICMGKINFNPYLT